MKKINISELKTLNAPLYILVAGGIGAGKSFVIKKYLDKMMVVDPDETTMSLGNGIYNPSNVAKSMAITKDTVMNALKSSQSFIQQGTSANLQSTINKMKQAKIFGYTTVLLYIDTSLSQSILNVSNRKNRTEISDTKIERTLEGSKHTFNFMAQNEITDNALFLLDKLNISAEAAQTFTDYTIHYKNFS